MSNPTVYGPSYSTYVRTTRLALEEKGVAYDLVDVPMMTGAHKQSDHLARHPFGKLPAFGHDGLSLYETGAITRYIDRALPGPALQPTAPHALARIDQAMAIVDSYAYSCLIGQLAWQRLIVPMQGGTADEAEIAASLPQAKRCLAEFARLLGADTWFGGNTISLADLHLAPVMAYAVSTPEGADMLAAQPTLKAWWGRIGERPSMAKTPPQFS
jgi:glutathione S-transferase